jgi:hypothetical protein
VAVSITRFAEDLRVSVVPGTLQFRRAFLFLVAIGTPVVVGIFTGMLQLALLGAMCGMLLSFADNDGALSSRLRLLLLDGGLMVAGGAVGYFSAHLPALFCSFQLLSQWGSPHAAAANRS